MNNQLRLEIVGGGGWWRLARRSDCTIGHPDWLDRAEKPLSVLPARVARQVSGALWTTDSQLLANRSDVIIEQRGDEPDHIVETALNYRRCIPRPMLVSSSSVLRLEEVRDSAHAELPLLDMWHVARMLEKYPSNTRNALHIRLHHLGRGLVVAAGDQQRRHSDLG
jgi:hypothetical protein